MRDMYYDVLNDLKSIDDVNKPTKKLHEGRMSKAQRHNNMLDNVFANAKKIDDAKEEFLLKNGFSKKDIAELRKNQGLSKHTLDDKLIELNLWDKFWSQYNSRNSSKITEEYKEDEEYVYEFAADDITKDDIKMMKFYNIKPLGKLKSFEDENYYNFAVKGKYKDLKKFCDDYLDYQLHPDYICPEEDFDYEDREWVRGVKEAATKSKDIKDRKLVTGNDFPKSGKVIGDKTIKENISSYKKKDKEIYQVETGVLLKKDDPEFDAYNVAFNKKYALYNENIVFFSSLKDAIDFAMSEVKDGVNRTYAVVSNAGYLNDDLFVENGNIVDSEGNDFSEDFNTFLFEDVVQSFVKVDDEIIRNFLNKDLADFVQIEESEK